MTPSPPSIPGSNHHGSPPYAWRSASMSGSPQLPNSETTIGSLPRRRTSGAAGAGPGTHGARRGSPPLLDAVVLAGEAPSRPRGEGLHPFLPLPVVVRHGVVVVEVLDVGDHVEIREAGRIPDHEASRVERLELGVHVD